MNTLRFCGCKGVRTCLQCEKVYNIEKPSLQDDLQKLQAWSYCAACERLYPGWDTEAVRNAHPLHNNAAGIFLNGILVQEDFLSASEGAALLQDLDTLPWTVSQSGRRKQNFGPKTNFKKRKLQNGTFCGFPAFSAFVQERFGEISLLKDFQAIEQCTLEYEPTKGAAIDAHIDDCWVWGERVVTVNCSGDAVLTMTLYNEASAPATKYNLDLVTQYTDKLISAPASAADLSTFNNCVIRIPMPKLSLIVLYGPARYQFEHAVLREDIPERRVCIAYREFTPLYTEGGVAHKEGEIVTQNAKIFWKSAPTC